MLFKFCDFRFCIENKKLSIFKGLSIVKFLWFFVTFRRTEQTQHDRGQNRAKIASVGKIPELRLVRLGMIFIFNFVSISISPMIFSIRFIFFFRPQKMLLLLLLLLPVWSLVWNFCFGFATSFATFATGMSFSLKIVI